MESRLPLWTKSEPRRVEESHHENVRCFVFKRYIYIVYIYMNILRILIYIYIYYILCIYSHVYIIFFPAVLLWNSYLFFLSWISTCHTRTHITCMTSQGPSLTFGTSPFLSMCRHIIINRSSNSDEKRDLHNKNNKQKGRKKGNICLNSRALQIGTS